MSEHNADAPQELSNPFAERVQIGARIEKRMVKVLKGLAEYLDISLGDLLEGIVLHAFESKPPFSAETLRRIQQLKEVYGMDYDASVSHKFPPSAGLESL